MLKNYFKIAFRSLFKNKFHTLLNLLGLIIGFTISMLVLLMVYGQFTFDESHANRSKIFRAYLETYRPAQTEISNVFGYPAAPAFKAESAAIDEYTRFMPSGQVIFYKEKEFEISTTLVDEGFFGMFSFPVAEGQQANLLGGLADLVITKKTATAIFGKEDAIGKTVAVDVGGQKKDFMVTAVVLDPAPNSSIRFQALARIENRPDYAADKSNWNNQHHEVYVMLKDGNTAIQAERELRSVLPKYTPEWLPTLKQENARPDKNGDLAAIKLISLQDAHFAPHISGRNAVSKTQVYVMLAIGLVIILIASFNYININLATALTRSKEIGVRKCLGAGRQNLFAQLWGESFLLCCFAFILSVVLAQIGIGIAQQNTVLNLPLKDMMWRPAFLALALGLLLLVSLIAGGYPSWMMARFQVVETLKNQVSLKKKSVVRSTLIVAQFVIACVMIGCTLVIYRQFNYLRNADIGLQKEYVISVPLKHNSEGRDIIEKLRSRLSSNPDILSLSGGFVNIGLGLDRGSSKISNGYGYKDKLINTNISFVDYDFLKTFGVKAIEGGDITVSATRDTLQHVLLTESAARQFEGEAIAGASILLDSSKPAWYIKGIIPDFHLYSLHEAKEPLALVYDASTPVSYCFIKTNGRNTVAVMDAVKKEMALLEPGREFKGSFIDDNIEAQYQQEKLASFIFSTAAAIAIILSCLGLLAMVLLMIQQRTKEIGVRKVLGASVPQIALLISREFMLLVLISACIATPLSWLGMHRWLQDFAYRIALSGWIFLVVAIMALVAAALAVGISTFGAARQNPVRSLRTE